MSYETNDKMVSHPDHYKSGKYEVIDIIDEFCKDLSGTEAVCTANAIKYILRWKKKNGVQDLKKAVWYLTHLIEQFTDAEPTGKEMFTPGVNRPADIDDEPEKLELRKNAAGVYIPQDQDSSEKIKRQLDGSKFGMAYEPDDFMNPPYDELLKQCEEYYKDNEHLKAERNRMLNQLENRTKHITRQSNEINAITLENNRLANENDKLDKENKKLVKRVQIQYEELQKLRNVRFDYRQILHTVSHRLSTNASFTKKQIRDYVETELKKDEGR